MISANSGLSEAPPTKNPSTSCCWAAEGMRILPLDMRYKHTKFFAVGSGNASTVQDLDVVGNASRDCLRKVRTHVGVGLLRLGACGNLASANGPDGLVGNHNFAGDQSVSTCLAQLG